MKEGKLILLPNVLDESTPPDLYLPPLVSQKVREIRGLFCESEKMARWYLRKFLTHDQMAALPLKLLNEHEGASPALLAPLLAGETWGLISDAGLPCIADPGADLVSLARSKGIEIEAVSGPCSLLLALQLSGFSGQRFAFHGYLPRETLDLERALKDIERRAKGETQIWIEAPYRSAKMLDFLKKTLHPNTRLAVAAQLTGPNQRVASQKVGEWKDFPLGKEPAVFLIYCS
jgi:16S rRNA (cytidine1402-2'-O)-methyltransferase